MYFLFRCRTWSQQCTDWLWTPTLHAQAQQLLCAGSLALQRGAQLPDHGLNLQTFGLQGRFLTDS